jgi:hypothetical protein
MGWHVPLTQLFELQSMSTPQGSEMFAMGLQVPRMQYRPPVQFESSQHGVPITELEPVMVHVVQTSLMHASGEVQWENDLQGSPVWPICLHLPPMQM